MWAPSSEILKALRTKNFLLPPYVVVFGTANILTSVRHFSNTERKPDKNSITKQPLLVPAHLQNFNFNVGHPHFSFKLIVMSTISYIAIKYATR